MSWVSVLKRWSYFDEKGSRRTFNNYNDARRQAYRWSFAVPHVIREKNGKYTVMMKRDTRGANRYGPIIYEEEGRR